MTVLSDDQEGQELGHMVRDRGVHVIDLGLEGPTPIKSRVRTDRRSLLMLSQVLDQGSPLRRSLTEPERAVVLAAAAVLVSDYGRGISHDDSVRSALEAAATRIPIVWDPHPHGARPVPGARLVTPNVREATQFTQGITGSGLPADIDRAKTLLKEWASAGVVVTRGADGAVLLDSCCTAPLAVPGVEVLEGDTCGAGDCFAVTVAGLLAERSLLSEAVTDAVRISADFVAAGGAFAVAHSEAAGRERPGQGADPFAMVARVRAAGGIIVATGGCFDLLHAGHIALLEQARRLGDCLIVCLNDDESVRRLKGAGRPVVSARDRAAVLGSLASVDGVMLFAEDTPAEALRRIRPDIYVKGGDYRVENVGEATLVATWGGRTVIVPYLDGRSTTNMIDKITCGGSRV